MDKLPNPIKYHIYHGQPLPEAWPYDYVLAGQGVIKRVCTPHFDAAIAVAACDVAGLPHYPDQGLVLKVPKIPGRLLQRVLEHARQAGSGGVIVRPVEQMYHFHWWPLGSFANGEWRVEVPRQRATAGRVRYVGGHAASVVLELHSHHQMDAYFSETDDRDEQGCRLYVVIGRIFGEPEIKLRLGIYGDFWPVLGREVFEG